MYSPMQVISEDHCVSLRPANSNLKFLDHDQGIEYDAADRISVRIAARNPGKAQIEATVHTAKTKQVISFEVTGNQNQSTTTIKAIQFQFI